MMNIFCDVLPRLKSWASKDKNLDGTQDLSNIVPASQTVAFTGEGLTQSSTGVTSGSSNPSLRILLLLRYYFKPSHSSHI